MVCEKPAAAVRIGQALGSSSFRKVLGKERPFPPIFFATAKNGQCFVICSSIGHLYGLDVEGKRDRYPVFDPKWMPIVKKRSKTFRDALVKSELVIESISYLAKRATSFVHACDYDREGELIGYNILEYACNNKYDISLRAKLSTLTDEEITNSFQNLSRPNRRLAEAGIFRHVVDFIYGVNVSRGLTRSFKGSNDGGRYCNFSMGRIQGPSLGFVVDREIAIKKYTPVPYWALTAEFEKNGHTIKAFYHQSIETLSKASCIADTCSGQDGEVMELKVTKAILKPPNPFNLGDLQKEAYRLYKFSPSYTLTIAERLYLGALISYPRTSSQKLPSSINFRGIILGISQIGPHVLDNNDNNGQDKSSYTRLALNLLSTARLIPNEGSKRDPAHPAIYPTGEKPKGILDIAQRKLFDLIVRRFLIAFSESAVIQHTTATFLVKDSHIFKAYGKKVIHEGWMHYYKWYSGKGITCFFPQLHRGEVLKNIAVKMTEKFTQPNFRYNQASLLKKMEKEKIGTEATRSGVISTLCERNYISNSTQGIKATDIGFEVIRSMRKHIPNIVSTELTRSIERQLDRIESGKISDLLVKENAIDKLKKAIVPFMEKETEIGNQITEAVNNTGVSN